MTCYPVLVDGLGTIKITDTENLSNKIWMDKKLKIATWWIA